MKSRRSLILAALPFIVLAFAPAYLGSYHLVLVGRFLSLGIAAMGIVLIWGQGGVLPLGQGVFFGLGGYALAMHLKLVALPPGELPDFMQWNGVETLPWWWQPFERFPFAVLAVIAVPVIVAFPLSYALFMKRVSGVYFAIVTLALALTLTVLIIGQQGDTGGANGITDFKTLLGMDITSDASKIPVVDLISSAACAAPSESAWIGGSNRLRCGGCTGLPAMSSGSYSR